MNSFVLKLSRSPVEIKALESALDALQDATDDFPTDEDVESATIRGEELRREARAPLSRENVDDAAIKEHYRLMNEAKVEMATAPTWGRVYMFHEPSLDAHLEAVAGLIEALGAVKLADKYRWFSSEEHKALRTKTREGSKKELFEHPKEHGYDAWKAAIIACVKTTRLSLISPARALIPLSKGNCGSMISSMDRDYAKFGDSLGIERKEESNLGSKTNRQGKEESLILFLMNPENLLKTQRAISEEIGVSQASVSRMLKNPKDNRLKNIVKARNSEQLGWKERQTTKAKEPWE